MGDFAKALSQLSRSIASTIAANSPPYIHCSKINGFIQLLRNLAPLLGTATKKLTWGQRGAMEGINNVLQEFKLTHSQCIFDNCSNFALNVSVKTVYNQCREWLKELRKDFEQLGIQGANEYFAHSEEDLDQQERVDLKRISEIIIQIREKNTKSRTEVTKRILLRTKSLESFGLSLRKRNSDVIVIAELPESLNLILQHEDLEFGKQIGDGISGRVVKGMIKSTGQEVAIKILHTRQLSNADMERYRNEIFAMSTLLHPTLLPFCGYTQEPPYCMATQFMENGSLFHALTQKPGFLTPTDRTLIAYDVARGMEFLHSRGVIHRDLKSLNILIDENKRGKICDFGFVRMKSSVPMTGLIGTSHWMAPEILLSNPNYDEKVDVYSYGILLWELLTSQQPYAGENPQTLPVKIIESNLRPTIPQGTPTKIKSLIENCWCTDPEHRPSFKDIVTSYSDPEYHFPGSERFVLLRETGQIGMHTKTSSESDYPRRPFFIRRNMTSHTIGQTKKNEGILAMKRVNDAIKQGHIEAFKNAITRFRDILSVEDVDWASVIAVFSDSFKAASNYFKGFLVQVYFEMLSYQHIAEVISPDTIITFIKSDEPNIVSMSLSMLALSRNPALLTDNLLESLLEFRKNGDQSLRVKAAHVILTLGTPEQIAKHLNHLLMFALRRLPEKRLETLLKMVLESIKISTEDQLDENIYKKLMIIAENAPYDYISLANNCIYCYHIQKNTLNPNFVDFAISHYEDYKFIFDGSKDCPTEDIPLYVKQFTQASMTSKAACVRFAELCSEREDFCRTVIQSLPLKLPKEHLCIVYNSILPTIDAASSLLNEEFYVVASMLLGSQHYEKICTILKNEVSSLAFAEKNGVFEELIHQIDIVDDHSMLLAFIPLMFNYIRRTGSPAFCPAAPRLSELFASNDNQISPLSFACLVMLSKFRPPGLNIDALNRAAIVFSKTMTGTVQTLATILLSQSR